MANLVSPGVQVTVTDESVYGPAGAGTVPMLFIATGQERLIQPLLSQTALRNIQSLLMQTNQF